MSLITFEGFENYSSWSGIQSILNSNINSIFSPTGSYVNQINIINSTDTSGITPRNNLSCIKLCNLNFGTGISNLNNIVYYPKILISNPYGTNHTSGVFGFNWFNFLPSGNVNRFTPIAGLIDPSGKPHFYIGVNSSGSIEFRTFTIPNIRSWIDGDNFPYTTNSSGVFWNTIAYSTVTPGSFTYLSYPLFDSSSYTSIANGATSSTIASGWNNIEVKYLLSNLTSGSIQIKLNKSASGTFDVNLNNIKTTQQNNINAMSLVFGRHFGNETPDSMQLANYNEGYKNTNFYPSYFDDIYWVTSSGSTLNDFLGRVSCRKTVFDKVNTYTFNTPSTSGQALTAISNPFGSIQSYISSNTDGQTINLSAFNASGISGISLSPLAVRQYAHSWVSAGNADLTMGADSITNQRVNIGGNGVLGHLAFRDYENSPDGSGWTNQKILTTNFKFSVTGV